MISLLKRLFRRRKCTAEQPTVQKTLAQMTPAEITALSPEQYRTLRKAMENTTGLHDRTIGSPSGNTAVQRSHAYRNVNYSKQTVTSPIQTSDDSPDLLTPLLIAELASNPGSENSSPGFSGFGGGDTGGGGASSDWGSSDSSSSCDTSSSSDSSSSCDSGNSGGGGMDY